MNLVEALRSVPLFVRLSTRHLLLLAEICEEQAVAPRTRLSRQADLGDTFFIIELGEALVHRVDEKGYQRPVGMIREGSSYGTTALFLQEPRDATVTAQTDMTIWIIQRRPFQLLLDRYPSMRRELLIPRDVLAQLRAPRYPWLEPGELVLHHCHRHWVVLARAMLFTTVAVSAYAVFLISLRRWAPEPLPMPTLIVPILVLYVVTFLWHWFDWRNDYFVVTNRRLSHRERVVFVYESRNESPLDRVQNINLVVGPMGSLLSFGTLTIETAAEIGSMTFDSIPSPETMREAIWEQIARAQAQRRAAQRESIRDSLSTQIDIPITEAVSEAGQDAGAESSHEENARTERPASPLVRFGRWLMESGIIPRTRIARDDTVIWRKHWLFLVSETILPLVASITLSLAAALGFFGWPAVIVRFSRLYPYALLVASVAAIGWLWWTFNDWDNDLYMVTNERIIDIEKRPLFFSEERREASLGMIQNVSLEVPNVIATALNYGSVVVQTAGAGEFTFDNVPNPHDVQNVIFQRMEAFREAQRERSAAQRRAEIAEWFGVYEEVRTHEDDVDAPWDNIQDNSEHSPET